MQNTECFNKLSTHLVLLNCDGEVLGQNNQISNIAWANDKDGNNYLENTFNTGFVDLSSSQQRNIKLCSLDPLFFHPNQLDCDPRKDFMNMSECVFKKSLSERKQL